MARAPLLITSQTRNAAMRAADAARRAALKVCAEAPIGSAEYRAAARTLDALGDLAKVLARTTATSHQATMDGAPDEPRPTVTRRAAASPH